MRLITPARRKETDRRRFGIDIVYHIGANCTDDDRLLKSLLKNSDALLARGIVVPGPSKYRPLIRETIQKRHGPLGPDLSRDDLINEILGGEPDPDRVSRLVMSNWRFICNPDRVFEDGRLYKLTIPKVRGLASLFPDDPLHLFFALRNPATFIPAVFHSVDNMSFEDFMNGANPHDILWSDILAEIRSAAPDAALTVWCNEDTPYLWEDILQAMTGPSYDAPLNGALDLVARLLPVDIVATLQERLDALPADARSERGAIIAEALETHALTAEIEEEIDLPGWTEATVRDLTLRYEADLNEIAEMDGIRFLRP